MKIHFPSNLYRYASITLAGTLTTGAILFSPDLQTFASSQNSLTASHSDANRDDSTLPPIYQPLATPSDAEHSSSEDRDEDNEIIATPSDATSSDAHKRPASPSDAASTPSNAAPKIERRKTPPLTEPKYDRTEGSEDVTNLLVPTLAYDDTSVTLVWNKPEKYDTVADYAVYQDGELIGTARENFAEHADWASTYMDAFYEYYEKKNIEMVNVDIHSFTADNLTPDTSYEFSVVALDDSGNPIGDTASVSASTAPAPEIFNITDFGARTVDTPYRSYDDGINRFIEENTKAIQAAIDACTEGGKVVVPSGIFMSGALYLKSNMTLELEKGAVLFGSPNADHYDSNYLLYPYSTDTRSWALINAYSSDEGGMLENIRITGEGTIDGNGWKYGEKDDINGDGYSMFYQDRQAADPEDKAYRLPRWVSGNSKKLYTTPFETSLGILASDATLKAKEKGLSEKVAYNNRPNLIVIRGTENVYIGDITVRNPAFHTVAVLDSKNVTSNNVKYTTYDSNNADGIELGNTQNAIVFNNFFDTGDDSINFATGMGKGVQDCEQKPSQNIWTFNNFLREGHGGAIAAGSHTGAGICDMLVEDNVLNHSDMPFRFKSAPANGGGVWDVLIRDCAVGECSQAFVMSTTYSDVNQAVSVEPADTPAEFRNINAYNLTIDDVKKNEFSLVADVDYSQLEKPWHTHHDLYFQDITFTNSKMAQELKGVEDSVFYNVRFNDKDEDSKAWSKISASGGLNFAGDTTTSDKAENAMDIPEWTEDAVLTASPSNASRASADEAAELTWTDAADYDEISGYIIETRADGQLVDISTPVTKPEYQAEGLCANVDYTFTVYAVDATGNKTEGPSAGLRIESAQDETLNVPSDRKVRYSGEGYTWASATFANGSKADPRIRGYHAYADGVLVKTIYNYELGSKSSQDELTLTIGRLMETENEVIITAFADNGDTFDYESETVKLSHKYDFKAPEWDSSLDVREENGDLILSWEEPWDESGIYGYRIYMDGKPVYADEDDYFNHVNSSCTTTKTSYRISGADLETSHTFKVEAADNWWKALNGTGPFHWTYSGPQAVWNREEVTVSLSPQNARIAVGGSIQLHAEITPAGLTASWTSSDPSTASVDENGLVTGLRPGQAVITVSAGGQSASSAVTVNDENVPEIPSIPDNSDSDGSSGSGTSVSGPGSSVSSHTILDSKKGYVNTVSGIITGNGTNNSHWIQESGNPSQWKLQYADGTFAAGSIKTAENGTVYEQPAWEMINGAWYAFGADGYTKSGFFFDHEQSSWFFIDINSGMKTGWQQIENNWYYFNPVSDGTMGKLYTSATTPDGYQVDENGRWIQ